jgi:hypothetical protein
MPQRAGPDAYVVGAARLAPAVGRLHPVGQHSGSVLALHVLGWVVHGGNLPAPAARHAARDP